MPLRYFPIRPIILIACLLSYNCSSKKDEAQGGTVDSDVAFGHVDYEVTEDKSAIAQYYKVDFIKEYYPERFLPPVFDYNIDISKKNIVELWLLRNEIFARNGYLFDDAVLRGHFDQFKWYQPIFDIDTFKVQLNKEEQSFVDRILARENELAAGRYHEVGQFRMLHPDHIYNTMQFKDVPEKLMTALTKDNFAIVPARHEQLFHVYDKNHYEYIPNFVTTDLYLQVLHKHFSSLLQNIEEEKFVPLLTELLQKCHQQSRQFEQSVEDEELKASAKWSTTYLAIALSLLNDQPQAVSPDMKKFYSDEVSKVKLASGNRSEFLNKDVFNYSEFKPRGNYTKTAALEKYFRCVKWLNSAPISATDDERFFSAVLIASFIRQSPELKNSFEHYNGAVRFIVGDEDNLSIGTVVSTLTNEEATNPKVFKGKESLDKLRQRLYQLETNRIRPQGGDAESSKKLAEKTILFTAGRYTFDGEILSRLVHVLQPSPLRKFPKGLDVFAAFGNSTAQNILLTDYEEGKLWKQYPDSLKNMKEMFSSYDDWNKNLYSKTFEAIQSLERKEDASPLFMQTPKWKKKNLITALAAWTELKHDMLLYSEQPYAAEAGEGGGPPPPMHISYVEPNMTFWRKSLELLELQNKTLTDLNLMTNAIQSNSKDLKEIAEFLLKISEKELSRENLTHDEFQKLSWIGGEIEYLTFRICGTNDHLPEKEKQVALVADVYSYNGTFLEEAVGTADEIYVVAEINGKPYITRGAVFSYYEFTSEEPLTDEAWQSRLLSNNIPERPKWTNEITVETNSLESKPDYSF